MLAYIFLFPLIVFLSVLVDAKKENKILSPLVFFLLFLPIGLRSVDVGNDTHEYFSIFYRLYNHPDAYVLSLEPAYSKLNYFLYYITNGDFNAVLFSTALFSVFFIFYTIQKYALSTSVAMAFFLSLGPYFFLHSGIRQGMALSLVFLSLSFILNEKKYKFALTILLASLFHASAIIFIPVYYLVKVKVKPSIFIVLWLISVPFAFSPVPFKEIILILKYITPHSYSWYYDDPRLLRDSAGLGLKVLFNQVVFLFLIKSLWVESIKDTERKILYLSIVGFILSNVFVYVGLIGRIGLYFSIFNVLGVPIAMHYLVKGKSKVYIKLCLFLLLFLLFYRQVINDDYSVFPYTTWLC